MPKLKSPYLKKFLTLGKITVWIVDGMAVRKNLDEEFTNFGQHYRFNCIPKWEFWLDKEFSPGEEFYFIDHLMTEFTLMQNGMSYPQAISAGDKLELIERSKSKLAIKCTKMKKKHDPELLKLMHKKKLTALSTKNLTIWIVNGEAVRNAFFIDFTCGGHEFVYHFVPKGEIWLDDDMNPKDCKFVLLHELHERARMKSGWPYPKAHYESSRLEFHCRHVPKELAAKLKIEQGKNKT